MVGPVLLGLGLLGGLLLIAHWYAHADPRQVLKVLRWSLLALIVVLVFGFAVSGRLGWAIGALSLLLPWLPALLRAARTAKTYARMSGMKSGQRSNVETAALRMSLNTDTGDLSGEVISGPHAGSDLGDLSLADLVDLLKHYRGRDEQSAQLLTAYLDRCHPDWRTSQAGDSTGADAGSRESAGATPGGEMTREQALGILGLPGDASEAEIKAAHHRLIGALHPDRGGSSLLAAQVNRAKDILLGKS